MKLYQVNQVGMAAIHKLLRRDALQDNAQVDSIVQQIIARVKAEGDAALLALGRQFDSPELQQLEVPKAMLEQAANEIPSDLRRALELASENIRTFHKQQLKTSWIDPQPGKITGQTVRPLKRVGLYVPGGTAAYPSTVLMIGIPARVAGVEELILCTPAQKNGMAPLNTLAAAHIAGVDSVFLVGGAQAVAAMAFGTETIPVVDKIVGPGNSYVNVAKRLLWGVVDMDMLAGPSEVCVLADAGANPEFAALDLLTQVEHDPECAGYLITPSMELATAVQNSIHKLVETMPRSAILTKALEEHGAIIVCDDMQQACELADVCAPEHLALMVRDPFSLLGSIHNAGAILMGDYSPQTLGDYLAGPSHTLPTSGTARFASPLHVDTFLKKSSYIYYSEEALREVAATLTTLARAEGFETHAAAVDARTVQMESVR